MIVCDRPYLQELRKRMKRARKVLQAEDAEAIDAEIAAIEAQGEPWYGTAAMVVAFRMGNRATMNRRVHCVPGRGRKGFQGNLPKLHGCYYEEWDGACSVNKDTLHYRTWTNPDDAIRALALAHRIVRYEQRITGQYHNHWKLSSQYIIDKWRNEHGNTTAI